MIDWHDADLPDVPRVFARSAIVRALDGAIRAIEQAAANSRMRTTVRSLGARFSTLPAQQQIRILGVLLLSFGATYFLVASALPPRSAPRLPAFVSLPALYVGLILLLSNQLVAAARARRQPRQPNQDSSSPER